jgi:hypothetical protein
MQRICRKYAGNMQEICRKYTRMHKNLNLNIQEYAFFFLLLQTSHMYTPLLMNREPE